MRQRDEDFITMTGVTVKTMDKYRDQWEERIPMVEMVETITVAVGNIEESRKGAGTAVSTGVTKDKEAAADKAIDRAVKLAGYVQVYARRQQNHTLSEQMQVKRKELERMEDGALVQALEDVHDRITALGDAVAPYGVTAEKLAAFKEAIEAYKPLKDAPRSVIVTRKGVNSSVPALVATIRNELKNLDLLMEDFADTAPVFYRDYRNARIIVDRNGGRKEEGE